MSEILPISLTVGVFILSISLYFNRAKYISHDEPKLPPGPKGLPLLGNISDLPRSRPWVTFKQWADMYGDIVHLNAMGKHIIILNSAQYAIDMLDKKGRLYSDRPTFMMAGKFVGWDRGPALIPVCNTWSEYRRLFSQFMGTRSKIDEFGQVLQEGTDGYMKKLFLQPHGWVEHTRRYAGEIVLILAYGYKTTSMGAEDYMVKLVDEAMDQFSETTAPGAYLVDSIPFLQYVPSWFPGTTWKNKALRYRQTLEDMVNVPYKWSMQEIAQGAAQPSFLSKEIENKSLSHEEEVIIKWAAAGIYSGGADTTVAGIESFFLAMTLQKSSQTKAQQEIDAVIGKNRFPSLQDRGHLPYIDAMLTEVLRFYTFMPVGLPHMVCQDDVHNGYYIPKNSIIITNNKMFFNDPKTYPEPEKFSPDRFLEFENHTKEVDPRDYLFGFGRRTCPGIHLADASMWLACVTILAAFDISPKSKDGNVMLPTLPTGEYMDGSISHPKPFEIDLTPRSNSAQILLQSLQGPN